MPILRSFLAGFCIGAAATKAKEGEPGKAAALATTGLVLWETRHKPIDEVVATILHGQETKEEKT